MSDIDRWTSNVQKILDWANEQGFLDDVDAETNIVDLLADLMHYCRLNGIEFEDKLRIATNHFTEEVRERN